MKFATLLIAGEEVVAAVDPASNCYLPLRNPSGQPVRSMLELIGNHEATIGQFDWNMAVAGFDKAQVSIPIRPVRNIMCVGKNYREHAREFTCSGFDSSASGLDDSIPDAPIVFTKAPETPMTKSLPKLVLSSSRDIPFFQLVLSQKNVRRVKAGLSIEDLAADIYHRTLLQSLNVRAKVDDNGQETGLFEVPAGGRRFRALELLVKSKRMAKDQPVPCVVREAGIAEEDSLAENVMRVGLHPLDQFRAFAQHGTSVETRLTVIDRVPADDPAQFPAAPGVG